MTTTRYRPRNRPLPPPLTPDDLTAHIRNPPQTVSIFGPGSTGYSHGMAPGTVTAHCA